MFHLIKYCLITIIREKSVVFWSMLFPILLGTLFYMSFGSHKTELETIDVALVEIDNSEMSQNFIKFLEMIEDDNDKLVSLEKLSKEKAMINWRIWKLQVYIMLVKNQNLLLQAII